MLYDWANMVIVTDVMLLELVKDEPTMKNKVKLMHVGADRWGSSMHPDLVPICCKKLEEAGFVPKKTPEEINARRGKYDLADKLSGGG